MRSILHLFTRASVRFMEDRCFTLAASLAYASLLAVVPMVAFVLVVLTRFPVFQAIQSEAERAIFTYFTPNFGTEVQAYLTRFVANTGNLTALGLFGLAVSAVILLMTIEDAFNVIWRVQAPRRAGYRLLIYGVALTAGTILVAAALTLSTSTYAASAWLGIEGASTRLLPLPLTTAGFALMFWLLPGRPVHLRPALGAAFLVAALFELLKAGFGIYVRLFPAYETIYGALSVLPLFLAWMYCAWAVVLWGAELAATAEEEAGKPATR
ncbi:MAG: YihY family inner membrane protein [Alphaproteobacteria bacterium]|nr:YihY family inner membrane protein [Alphaproteobacteria bacterium]